MMGIPKPTFLPALVMADAVKLAFRQLSHAKPKLMFLVLQEQFCLTMAEDVKIAAAC